MQIKAGDILDGDFWPEPVRILTVQVSGPRVKIEAVGLRTQQFFPRILSSDDLDRVRVSSETGRDFTGRAEVFFLAVEGHRVRYAYQFDPLYAVNVSQVDPLPHQIEAVYHYILRNPSIRFLLADDPGAGKTIMTGLLLKELKYRGLVQRALIVVPGHLKDQWLREMKERFSETFTVVDRSVMNATWGRNVWQEQPLVITSMDFAKQEDVSATLAETQWDLVVVDEAHKMAAYRYGEKTTKTERYKFGELLSRISRFLLFLTATPHRGDPENFRLFLDLLEPGYFASTELLAESIRNKDNPLFLRRLKEDLKGFDGSPLFPPRHVVTKTFRLNDDEKRLYNAVTEYVENSYNRALAAEKRNVAFALLILQRRMASSVRAIRRSLERRRDRLSELLKLGKWLAERGWVDEDALEDAPELERQAREEELVERLTAAETREELQQEIDQLSGLIKLAKDAERHELETKLTELRKVMEAEHIQRVGEKLLIFTESRETLDYLAEKLKAWGYSVAVLHGGMNLDARIRSEHEFREQTQVMVSTEAGGEGINLQFCALMVNYDIPWNPNRLEQRMGRIHRYGQTREVHIYNLVASDTREGKVMETLFKKLEQIREHLGSDRVFDVIGEVLPGRSLKDLIVEAVTHRRSLDEIVSEIERIPDEEALRRTRDAVLEGLATRHVDLQRVLGETRLAKENRLVPEYIERFFSRACTFLTIPLEQRKDGLWRISNVPYTIRENSPSFKNSFGEVFREYGKLAFDKDAARKQQAVFVAPGHPLLEAVIERLLQESAPDLQKGAVFADPDGRFDGLLWFVEGEIRDGSNSIAGKRLFTIFQPERGALRLIPASILWDLKPLVSQPGWDFSADQGLVISFAVENVLEAYRNELLQQRERDTEIKRKYGIRSLEQMIATSDAKLIEYETRRMKGEEIPEPTMQNEMRTKDDLLNKKRRLEEAIRWETSLLPLEPRIVGVARVIPDPAPDSGLREDQDIAEIGMQEVIAYEIRMGRLPVDVSLENLGYDIRSTAHGAVRYIEVKARSRTGVVALTPNEWLMAHRLGDEYWLYIVENAASEPNLHRVQNPSEKFRADEILEIVRYVVSDWKQAAETEPEKLA
jgi:superfamily II DNA or RNA helicase